MIVDMEGKIFDLLHSMNSFDLVYGLLPFDLLVRYLFVSFFVTDLWCWSIGDLNSNFQLTSVHTL